MSFLLSKVSQRTSAGLTLPARRYINQKPSPAERDASLQNNMSNTGSTGSSGATYMAKAPMNWIFFAVIGAVGLGLYMKKDEISRAYNRASSNETGSKQTIEGGQKESKRV
eukprot:TRINITY_DN7305_c0_g1_i1.p1 TRINITY_DN7305_c0_g1~~TRINITY_DN7305_c0_g1_i1.p1  ORF type:complete len:111 (+),score=13.08 TRINITY_DN7305_c0_g1_i1:47-379(+)